MPTPSPVPLLDLTRQTAALEPRLSEAMAEVVRSGRFILGPAVEAFEREIGRYLGVDHAVGVASGTDALWLALRAHGVGPGDVVLTSPFTFFATASAVMGTGARVAFADIEPQTYNLDPKRVEAALAGRCPVLERLGIEAGAIRAVVPVHLYGQPVDLDAFEALAARHGVALVEDAAQALGARFGERTIGERAIGDPFDLACFSFFPSKNLGAFGDGGLVTTHDADRAARLRQLRAHGMTRRYHHEHLGTNSRLDALQAAVLSVKLPHLDAWVAARADHAAAYDETFAGLPGLATPVARPGRTHGYHQYTVRCPRHRDALAEHLSRVGIGHAVYYPVPLHQQPALAGLGYRAGDFPETEAAAAEVLSLPVFPELTASERSRVIEEVSRFFRTPSA
jgi:dTDP-4-amino-4,6-dideoxygalactose transaminase